MRTQNTLRREAAFAILLMVITLAARLLPGPRTIDDAYITFRYARNIVAGNGFVYNTGERVLGTTTPLYTTLMAVEAALAGRRDAATGLAAGFPELALLTNALADCLSAWLLYRLSRRLGNGTLVGVALAACWAIHPLSVTFAIGGMETSVFVALILGTFAAYLDGRWRTTGALAALALLTRPEALIAIALLSLDVAARVLRHAEPGRNTRIAGGIAAFVLPLSPWLIFATLTFGSPIPGSILAKGAAYQLPPTQALAAFLRTLVVPFSGVGDFSPAIGLILLAVYGALFATGAWAAIRSDSRIWPLFLFAAVYVAMYVAANPLIFRWYVVPPLPLILLGIMLGAKRLFSVLRQPWLATMMLAIASVAVVASAAGGWWMPDHGPAAIAPRMAYIKLELTYLEAAERLQGAVNPNTVIAAGDIGAIGYATGARIYDTLGLITPEARQYYPVPPEAIVPSLPYAIPAQLILDAEPDVVVILEAYGRNTFLPDPIFQQRYTRIDTLVSDATRDYDSAGMYVFVRTR
jgi:hypothetical protein